MNPLTEFDFKGHAVRTVEIDGKPFFVGRDVATCLGYRLPQKAIIDHCKGALKWNTLTKGGNQMMQIIPEPDVYRLILKSQAPNAEAFQDWVCEEVLPAIRRTGSYEAPMKRIPTSTELAMMVINRDKQIGISREMMAIIEPDWSTYGGTGRGGKERTKVRRAYFVSGKGRLAHAAVLLSLHGQQDLFLENEK